MRARIRRFALAGLVLTAAASAPPAGAQQDATPSRGPAAHHQVAPAGPTVDRAAVGVRAKAQHATSLDDAEAALQQRLGLGQARALMIVGFGAVIVGLLIGDDVGTLIAVAGTAVGLYGLYHYLR